MVEEDKNLEKIKRMEEENEILDIETLDKLSDQEDEELLYLPVMIERDNF